MTRIRLAALALSAAAVLSGCAQTTPGQVAMTTEPMSPDMSCADFTALSDRDRLKFTKEVLGADSSSVSQPVILSALVTVLCQRAPDTPVKDLLIKLRP